MRLIIPNSLPRTFLGNNILHVRTCATIASQDQVQTSAKVSSNPHKLVFTGLEWLWLT